jgi:hypothetical protein
MLQKNSFKKTVYCLLGATPDVDSTCYVLVRSSIINNIGVIMDYWLVPCTRV